MEGLEQTGIFRLAPEESDTNEVKRQLNAGTFKGCEDVNCIANLIKVWFRELPVKILDSITPEALMGSADMDGCLSLFHGMPQPEQGILLWLLDLLCKVVLKEETNKMGVKNLAIVFGPNLFNNERVSVDNPMEALMMSNKAGNFIANLLTNRLETAHGYKPRL